MDGPKPPAGMYIPTSCRPARKTKEVDGMMEGVPQVALCLKSIPYCGGTCAGATYIIRSAVVAVPPTAGCAGVFPPLACGAQLHGGPKRMHPAHTKAKESQPHKGHSSTRQEACVDLGAGGYPIGPRWQRTCVRLGRVGVTSTDAIVLPRRGGAHTYSLSTPTTHTHSPGTTHQHTTSLLKGQACVGVVHPGTRNRLEQCEESQEPHPPPSNAPRWRPARPTPLTAPAHLDRAGQGAAAADHTTPEVGKTILNGAARRMPRLPGLGREGTEPRVTVLADPHPPWGWPGQPPPLCH